MLFLWGWYNIASKIAASSTGNKRNAMRAASHLLWLPLQSVSKYAAAPTTALAMATASPNVKTHRDGELALLPTTRTGAWGTKCASSRGSPTHGPHVVEALPRVECKARSGDVRPLPG
eukprot:TRINITY_DN1041_c0_g1_i2.p2 TRINITY_DN1041_c0_g1~~TRINITY_DN1041_c0_g1_i2.p2  ORF type:complete len:118 (+),score=9.31 TRINITY_DN1041_c0_g1_i2:158-511(+)